MTETLPPWLTGGQYEIGDKLMNAFRAGQQHALQVQQLKNQEAARLREEAQQKANQQQNYQMALQKMLQEKSQADALSAYRQQMAKQSQEKLDLESEKIQQGDVATQNKSELAADADNVKFLDSLMKQESEAQKQEQAKLKPVAARREVRHILNPAYYHGGVLNTNVPPTLSLTNTVTPLEGGSSEDQETNAAPAGAATAKLTTQVRRRFNPFTGENDIIK